VTLDELLKATGFAEWKVMLSTGFFPLMPLVPLLNTYYTSIYMAYNLVASNFMFHYEEVLQIAILLMRMRNFMPFVERHFKATPKCVSLGLFLLCLAIKTPAFFAFKIVSLGDFYYLNSTNKSSFQIHRETLYFFDNSDFAQTPHGQLSLFVTEFVLNLFACVSVGLTLNILSFVKFKLFLRRKRR
jgi:hypothetical protein